MTPSTQATRWERCKGLALHWFPHHWLSRLTYHLARLETPLKNPLVRAYIRFFKVDMHEAEASYAEDYPSFNAFFTRALKPGARSVCRTPNGLACPCDGTVTQIGEIEEGLLLQAKGRRYEVEELLGGACPPAREDARAFARGKFCSIYLSPRDYHRVHAPAEVRLETMTHVPGRLFSVASYALKVIPRLYLRNERVACTFESALGRIAVVMVGALNVGSIETVWSGPVTPGALAVTRANYTENAPAAHRVVLEPGEELGRFNLGSCVIVLAANPELAWSPAHVPGKPVRMGEELGCLLRPGNFPETAPPPPAATAEDNAPP